MKERILRVDKWVEQYLNLDQALHWLSHHWKPVGFCVAGLLLVAYALSGIVIVGPDEVAIVRRFGRPLDGDRGPGIHWCWPWPVDRVVRVQPQRVRIVDIGFRTVGDTAPRQQAAAGSLSWAIAHREGTKRVPDESMMITGDGNLVEVQAAVRYVIDDPRTFLFEVGEPGDSKRDVDAILRAATEAVLREAVAEQPFLELMTVNRERFQANVLARLNRRCKGYGADGLGIRLEGLELLDLHPPGEVVDEYYGVARAMEQKELLVNQAQGEARALELQTRAKVAQLEQETAAEVLEKVRTAEVSRDGFLAQLRARSELGPGEELHLLSAAGWSVARGEEPTAAYQDYQRRRQDGLAMHRFLTDYRLALDVVSAGLGGATR